MVGILSQGKIWTFPFHEAKQLKATQYLVYITDIQICANIGTSVDVVAMIVCGCQAV